MIAVWSNDKRLLGHLDGVTDVQGKAYCLVYHDGGSLSPLLFGPTAWEETAKAIKTKQIIMRVLLVGSGIPSGWERITPNPGPMKILIVENDDIPQLSQIRNFIPFTGERRIG